MGPIAVHQHRCIMWLLLVLWLPWSTFGLILPDGICNLNVMLPFTTQLDRNGEAPPVSTGAFTKSRIYSVGYSQMASAVLAMNHFNRRDGRITPEVAELGDCDIRFGINETYFLDTGTVGIVGNGLLFNIHQEQSRPFCGIAGPFNELPARNVATMAAAAQAPHIPHRGYSITLSLEHVSPMTTNISPDQIVTSQAVVSHLLRTGRSNYIALLYPVTDIGVQFGLILGRTFDAYGIDQYAEYGYLPPLVESEDVDLEIPSLLQKVKDRGFRTIIVTLDVFIFELPALADAAEALNMLNGDYVFVFVFFEKAAMYNAIQLSEYLVSTQGLPSFGNATKLLQGAALISELEGHQYLGDEDPFLRVWKEQDAETVGQINALYLSNAIQQGKKDLLMAPNYFQTYDPEEGSGRLYDAIIAMGLGACSAKKDEFGFISGTSHVEAIRNLEYMGVTGDVKFGDSRTSQQGAVRRPETNVFGLYNLYPPSVNETKPDADKDSSFNEAFVLTDILSGLEGPFTPVKNPGTGIWTQYGPRFVYADGRVVPPELLRDVPEQNYLSRNLRIVGFTLLGGTLLACAMSAAFVVFNWNHRVIRASQPNFLVLLLFGAAMTSLAILTVSFDESYGWDENALSKACVATPWLFCCGHCVTYGALFSKLWRVNKVLQFTRRKISAGAVAGPLIALLLATVVVLTTWTLHDPLTWTRTEVDEFTGESIGQCDSDHGTVYLSLLGVVVATPTMLTCIMAWKTKDIDTAFSESKWIFTLIILQIQVIMVAIPIVIILRGTSTDGRYMGLVLLIFSFPATTVLFIMGPKFGAYFQNSQSGSNGSSVSRRSRGAPQGGVRVSGISGLSGATSNNEMESAFVERKDSKKVSFAAPNGSENCDARVAEKEAAVASSS